MTIKCGACGSEEIDESNVTGCIACGIHGKQICESCGAKNCVDDDRNGWYKDED